MGSSALQEQKHQGTCAYFGSEVFVALLVVGGGVALVPIRLAKRQWLAEFVALHVGGGIEGGTQEYEVHGAC